MGLNCGNNFSYDRVIFPACLVTYTHRWPITAYRLFKIIGSVHSGVANKQFYKKIAIKIRLIYNKLKKFEDFV